MAGLTILFSSWRLEHENVTVTWLLLHVVVVLLLLA